VPDKGYIPREDADAWLSEFDSLEKEELSCLR